ncbi:MAG: glycine cleavage system protein GcvH [Clostridia bacterium]|nr:glycine cleavage system protein GcvH [Clostridia bacterium]MBQ4341782.1 glycine cleavage system protein GcvH [Clostridia bacterium]
MVPNDRKYTRDHEWVMAEGNVAKMGITAHAAEALGDIVYVELPVVDDEVTMGESYCVVESVKASSSVFSAVTGKVVEINEELDAAPEKLNEDAYGNFIAAVEFTEIADDLMDAEEYEKFCAEEA